MLLYILTVAYLCFGKLDSLPDVKRSYFGIDTDKIVHFLMFLPFPILSYFCAGRKFSSPWQAVLFTIVIFFIGCMVAAGTEMGQSLTNYRVSDPLDFKADALALALSSTVMFIIILIQNIHSRA